MNLRLHHRRITQGIAATGAFAVLAYSAPAAVHAQEPGGKVDADSVRVTDNKTGAGFYQYVIGDRGKIKTFRLEVKQNGRGTAPTVSVNGEPVALDSTGSTRIDLPSGGHITIGQDAREGLAVAELLRIQEEMQRALNGMGQGTSGWMISIPNASEDSSAKTKAERE